MKLKHNFEVNQVWVSDNHPEKSFFIYQLYHPDYDDAAIENDSSFYIGTLINEKLFNKIVERYQEKHNVKDRSVTYPYCIFKEGTINSLKQFIRKWDCHLSLKENFETVSYDGGEFIVLKEEEKAIKEVWDKYSK